MSKSTDLAIIASLLVVAGVALIWHRSQASTSADASQSNATAPSSDLSGMDVFAAPQIVNSGGGAAVAGVTQQVSVPSGVDTNQLTADLAGLFLAINGPTIGTVAAHPDGGTVANTAPAPIVKANPGNVPAPVSALRQPVTSGAMTGNRLLRFDTL